MKAMQELIVSGEYDEKYDLNEDGVLDLIDIQELGQSEMGGDI